MALDDFIRKEITALPDGPMWISGSDVKKWFDEILRDRARGGSNIDETPTRSGRFFNAKAGGAAAAAVSYDLQILNKNDADHPGRVQVRAGNLGGVWPGDGGSPPVLMYPGDPSGYEFYLTLENGHNYILASLAVATEGTFGVAEVYADLSSYTPDASNVYLLIGTADYDGTSISNIVNSAKGSQSLVVFINPDASLISGFWASQGA